MRRYRGIIFDLDGTLVDSYRAITASLNAARAHFGLEPVGLDQVRSEVGRGLEALIEDHLEADRVAQGVTVFREHYETVFLEQTEPLEQVVETVQRLAREKTPMCVASNKPSRFGRRIVESIGLGSAFTAVLGPDEQIPPKPEPTMLTRACEAMDLDRDAVVYVGDMPLDVRSAEQAGLEHLLVPTGSATLDELLKTRGARVVSRFAEIIDFVDFSPGLQAGKG